MLLLTDARAGVTPGDEELADLLRRSGKPVLVVANKVDDRVHEPGPRDQPPRPRRAGRALGAARERNRRPAGRDRGAPAGRRARAPPGEEAIRVAILGRPNVGKSSLLNALLGEERVIVADTPGTTRDAIDTVLRREDTTFVLVDTAGLRRKRKHRQGIEYWSELRAREAADRADVALVLIDASQGLVEGDLAVADLARKANCSTIVVLSKWDISQIRVDDIVPQLRRRLRQRPPAIAVSAHSGRGIGRLLDAVEAQFAKHLARVSTGELNRFLGDLREVRRRRRRAASGLNLLYGTQVTARPPRFRFFVNDPGLVTRDYGFWVENELRERFELQGVPVVHRLRPTLSR